MMMRALDKVWFALAALCVPSGAAAQIVPPPRHDAQSPQGVSYRNGTFSYQDLDLSIGGGFPQGLSLTRSYNSASSTAPDVYSGAPQWTHSLMGYVTAEKLPPPDPDDTSSGSNYIFNVTVGGHSAGFYGGSADIHGYNGGPIGSYTPASPSGASLVFNGTTIAGNYIFTDTDGSVITFTAYTQDRISNWVFPDGTRLDYSYDGVGAIKSVISNRGYAILFDGRTKICAVNMSQTYITATSTCPSDAQAVTYSYVPGVYNPNASLLASVTKGSAPTTETTTYSYVGADHLGCVKNPTKTNCSIQNTYASCPEDPNDPHIQPAVHYKDPVISQLDAAGITYSYSYNYPQGYEYLCPVFVADAGNNWSYLPSVTRVTVNSSVVTTVESTAASLPDSIKDPLNRTTTLGYSGTSAWVSEYTDLGTITYPEGNSESYTRDDRGNITSKILTAKPGSGLADIVSTASYPASCGNRKTCNKPDYVVDAKGNRTDYTYDAAHGGVLTETGPAVGGVSPVKRYAYVQRYAWIKNAAGGYVQASSPVWLLSTEKSCRTSATVSGACSAGSAYEVTVTYDYGPDSGPNTLMLRGKAVTADVGGTITTLRTCYGYDASGNKISETSPRAGLAVCS